MIRLIAFDLDGTLVETEHLKALSYARAAVELRPGELEETQILEAYKEVVGCSREEVAETLLHRFGLERAARSRMDEFGVDESWRSFVEVRLTYYDRLANDPDVLRDRQNDHALALLGRVRDEGYGIAMATTSRRSQAQRVLWALGVRNEFDFSIAGDEVDRTKPHPEAYLRVLDHFDTDPEEAVAIEDSPTGIEAALAAGLHCIGATTRYTRDRVHAESPLPEDRIVDDPEHLSHVLDELIQTHGSRTR